MDEEPPQLRKDPAGAGGWDLSGQVWLRQGVMHPRDSLHANRVAFPVCGVARLIPLLFNIDQEKNRGK